MAGLDKAELKKFLRMSQKRGPMNMALAVGGDGNAIIQIDKQKQPRSLERGIKDDAPDAKNHRFGTVFVDPEEPKVAQFIVNKAGSGLARKLVKQLKGTGFTKVKLMTEDGATFEEDQGEDEEVAEDAADGLADGDLENAISPDLPPPGAPAAETAAADAADPAAPQQDGVEPSYATGLDLEPEAAAADPGFDPQALTRDLTGLVKQMLAIIKSDPSQKAALAQLATDAQASLKRGDLPQAAAAIEVLRQAIDAAGPDPASAETGTGAADTTANGAGDAAANGAADAAAAKGAAEPAAANGDAAPKGANPAFAKSRVAWLATRQRVEGEIDKLHGAMSDVYKDHGVSADLEKFFRAKVEPVLATLDETLAEKLDEVTQNTDPAQHDKLVQDARRIIEGYEQYLAREPLIAVLDNNPFVPLTIEKTLSATLTALSRAVA